MLPTINNPTARQYRPDEDPDRDIVSGSWWRLTDKEHRLASFPCPEHGLVLYLSKVNRVDGSVHSVTLAPHPMWSQPYTTKLMASELLSSFVVEPDGSALRAREIDLAMAALQSAGDALKSPPPAEELLLASDVDKAEAERTEPGPEEVYLPAALRPSKEIIAARQSAERQLAAMEAQKNWIEARTKDMSDNMALVQAYHKEHANQSLACIADDVKSAENTMSNAHTLSLFLGEDISVEQLCDGVSAPSSEPLTFLQRLLFLDEEVVVEHELEGINGDHLFDLKSLVSQNPGMIDRMMPYSRCVVIARARRNTRSLGNPTDIQGLFEALAKMEADELIRIFVRDGEKVFVITADKDTSGAKRLFPSEAEIKKLFSYRAGFGSEAREITPDVVDYADAREEHDARALFYKRFLLMFWGLHAREGLFGPFMDREVNWLSESTHSERFRFVHDEEDVLGDGRPSVQEYVKEVNKSLCAGSRIVARWDHVANEDTAPAICSVDRKSYRTIFNAEFANPIDVEAVAADAGELIVRPLVGKWSARTGETRWVKTRIRIEYPVDGSETSPEKLHERIRADGFLCLDAVSLEDIEYYINSRQNREGYLGYMHMFFAARRLLKAERVEEMALISGPLNDMNPMLAFEALRQWRAANRWKMPQKDSQYRDIIKLASALSRVDAAEIMKEAAVDAVGIDVKGRVLRFEASKACDAFGELMLPVMHQSATPVGRTPGDERVRVSAPLSPAAGVKLIQWAPGAKEAAKARLKQTPPGLLDPECHAILSEMTSDIDRLKEMERIASFTSMDKIEELLELTVAGRESVKGYVNLPVLRADVGLVTARDRHDVPTAWLLFATLDVPQLAAKMDGGKAVVLEAFEKCRYADPLGRFDRIKNRAALSFGLCRLKARRTLAKKYSSSLSMALDIPRHDEVRSWEGADLKTVLARACAIPTHDFKTGGPDFSASDKLKETLAIVGHADTESWIVRMIGKK
jgi:hypothetical protein